MIGSRSPSSRNRASSFDDSGVATNRGANLPAVARNVVTGRLERADEATLHSRPMRFSVWPTIRQPWPDLLEFALYAEATGWDGIWVADHFMPAAPPLEVGTLECWTVLTGLAGAVPRLHLGSLVTSITYRHPAVLANMASTLDQICGGRLVLGIGAGWQANEHHAYGIPFPSVSERLARLEEACAVIKGLTSRSRTSLDGRYYRLDDAPLEPKPVQARLPLLIGGGGETVTLRIAAKWADAWNTWGDPDVLIRKTGILDSHCEAVGRDPAEIARSAQAIIKPNDPAVVVEPHPVSLADLTGSVERLRDHVGRYAQAGVGEFIVPDWNTGRGQARRDFFDWFADEIAATCR